MKTRTVRVLLPADMIDMGGLPVRQPFPTYQIEQIDPFLLLHHADIQVPAEVTPRHGGVGPHPHRGFSPITFIFKGGVHHRDSRGNNSVVYAGGAQWMNAGMGVIHSERPPDDIQALGGRQEFIQLWVNTPARYKMDQPEYFPLQDEDIPAFISDDGLVTGKVVSGEVRGVKGPVTGKTPVDAVMLVARAGGRLALPLPAGHNAFLYLLDGRISIEGFGLTEGLHAAVFGNDGEGIAFQALADTRLLLMSGEPLHEKVVAQGPFVMNSETQILEAMRDYQMGKMGILIEE